LPSERGFFNNKFILGAWTNCKNAMVRELFEEVDRCTDSTTRIAF
jgi:hypothetical protein